MNVNLSALYLFTICSQRRKAILYSGNPDRILSVFSTQKWYQKSVENVYAILNEIVLEVFV